MRSITLVAIKTHTAPPERFDGEFRNHFLRIVCGEVDRSPLINELLEFARPSDR
jgi:hypothetical protein